MTTNTSETIDPSEQTLEADAVILEATSDTPTTSSISSVAGRLLMAAVFYAADLQAQQTNRPGANQPKAPAVVQPRQSPAPAPTTPAFKPTLGQPTPPKAVTPAKAPVTPLKSGTPMKPGTSVAPGAKMPAETLGNAKAVPTRLARRVPSVATLKKIGDSWYQTIAEELDEVALTNPVVAREIEAGFARLEVAPEAKEVDELYGALMALMTHSSDFKTPSKLDRSAVPAVAVSVREIMAAFKN